MMTYLIHINNTFFHNKNDQKIYKSRVFVCIMFLSIQYREYNVHAAIRRSREGGCDVYTGRLGVFRVEQGR